MRCPICKKLVVPPASNERAYTPFCSDRCQLIDLGRWLDGKYQVPVVELDPDEAIDRPPTDEDEDDSR